MTTDPATPPDRPRAMRPVAAQATFNASGARVSDFTAVFVDGSSTLVTASGEAVSISVGSGESLRTFNLRSGGTMIAAIDDATGEVRDAAIGHWAPPLNPDPRVEFSLAMPPAFDSESPQPPEIP